VVFGYEEAGPQQKLWLIRRPASPSPGQDKAN
jgi:hypothetical protein